MQDIATDPDAAYTQYRSAREDYRALAKSFQHLKNLSGAIFATGNAALMSAQLDGDTKALKVCAHMFF